MKKIITILILSGLVLLTGCKKDWLSAKPNKALVIPTNIKDFQALLDNTTVFNVNAPSMGQISCDDYYVTFDKWQSLYNNWQREAYIWAPDIYQGYNYIDSWNLPYQRILYENVALEGIEKITPDSTQLAAWQNVKGTALFCQAYDYYCLAQLFAKPYDATTAGTDPGIPARITSDANEKVIRGTVQETYDRIINDLKASIKLLPLTQQFKTRPTITAAYALLARTYLCMSNYDLALSYADSSLQLNSTLLDYNTVDSTAYNPLSAYDNEVLYDFALAYDDITDFSVASVDSNLYSSYVSQDLRRPLFYLNNGISYGYIGSYDPSQFFLFAGLATDEVYLISAECNARKGSTAAAMERLNTLLSNRWQTGTFTFLTATSADDALNQILTERRKELAFRGLRWTDLRRLNKESPFAVTVTRELGGQTYTLPPNDPRYVLPIPDNEIKYSGIAQNPR